jgi:hypothetical protein
MVLVFAFDGTAMYQFEWQALDFTVEKQGWFHNSSVADQSQQGPYSTGGLISTNQCTSGYHLSSIVLL